MCFFLLECIPMSTCIELLAGRQYLRSGIHGKSHYLAPFFNTWLIFINSYIVYLCLTGVRIFPRPNFTLDIKITFTAALGTSGSFLMAGWGKNEDVKGLFFLLWLIYLPTVDYSLKYFLRHHLVLAVSSILPTTVPLPWLPAHRHTSDPSTLHRKLALCNILVALRTSCWRKGLRLPMAPPLSESHPETAELPSSKSPFHSQYLRIWFLELETTPS